VRHACVAPRRPQCSSNRKVATADLDKVDADASARAIIEAQDRKISQMSGRPRRAIKAIKPVMPPRLTLLRVRGRLDESSQASEYSRPRVRGAST
jgi:hypothetical protein